MDDAKYVFESSGQYAGQYRSLVNGIGNPLVALGQGFFARVSAGATAATLTFRNQGRVVDFTTNTTFRRGAAETRPAFTRCACGPTARP